MFIELLEQRSAMVDAPVNISTEIDRATLCIGPHPILTTAIESVTRYCENEGLLRKSELLSIWGDAQISFASKCLITIWWGHPSHFSYQSVYSNHNLDILSETDLEKALVNLSALTESRDFLAGIRNLYMKFERGGDFHLNGINTAFFTKIFHFYFASHPIASNPDFLPVIADKWMKLAVYAEMADNNDNTRNTLFSIRDNNPDNIDFISHRGSSADSYLEFIAYFNNAISSLKTDYPELTPFILEDILFNDSKQISPLLVHVDNNSLFLPPWIAGRYNETESVAIIFNNLLGESYLFEDATAALIGELLKYEYYQPVDLATLAHSFDCKISELCAFVAELVEQKVIVTSLLNDEEIAKIRKEVVKNKRRFLRKSKGTEELQSVFALVDTDYRDRIEKQRIPSSVSFELTYGCNEMCIHCYNPNSSRTECVFKKSAGDEMMYADYCSVLDQLAELGVPKVLFTGGDPFMKKDFLKILQYAHKKKFAISIYTNGQALFNNSRYYDDILNCFPHTIGLSLYSIVPQIHEAITRVKGSCQKTKAIAERFSNDGVGLLIKCPIMTVNKDSYKDIYKYAIGINAVPEFEVNITSSVDGDEYAVKNLRLSEEEMMDLLKDPIIPLSTERKNISRYADRKSEMQFCGAGMDGFNIQPNGEVTPCIAFVAPCGNVKEQSVFEIWSNSKTLQRVRQITYGDSDRCGKETYCKYCNRCIGQSYTEHGVPENKSEDNCFIAKIRERIDTKNK